MPVALTVTFQGVTLEMKFGQTIEKEQNHYVTENSGNSERPVNL